MMKKAQEGNRTEMLDNETQINTGHIVGNEHGRNGANGNSKRKEAVERERESSGAPTQDTHYIHIECVDEKPLSQRGRSR